MEFLALASSGPEAATGGPAAMQALVGAISAWFEKYAAQGKIAWAGHQLDGPETAKTIRAGADGTPIVTDGPFVEAKEGIGGIAAFECESMAEAVQMSKAWATDFG
ncbi:MAG: YciI family protein, partial [Jiangellaceae bacterium]